MNMKNFVCLSSALVLSASASLAFAQTKTDVEAVVPVGEPVVPVAEVPVGPAIQPVIPVEKLEGVDTVTLNTPSGPVVVVSWPTSAGAAALDPTNNVDFGGIDGNRDNYLTHAELKAAAPDSSAAVRLASRFDAMDVNNDDQLDSQEVLVWVYKK